LKVWTPTLVAVLAVLSVAACYDPVHLDAVATLGPETPGIPTGPEHRVGQPCLTCHGGEGPADRELAVAGTVVATRGSKEPLVAAKITVTDARGESREMRSNGVGNFSIPKGDWPSITFPLRVVLEAESVRREMVTSIGRDGGCAACHRDEGDRTLMPSVFLRDK
jgi:hypothetical protein